MTTLIVLLLLVLPVGLAVFRPLLAAEFDRDPGPGREVGAPPAAGEALAELDAALAEGKLTAAAHAEETRRLGQRQVSAPGGADGAAAVARPHRPAAYPFAAAAGWAGAILLTLLVALVVEGMDIRSRVAPDMSALAASGGDSAPVPGVPPVGEDFVPDIGAMIAGLESRILSGEVVEADIEMLVRSYTVLEREGEVTGFLRDAVDLNPDHPVLLLALAIRLYGEAGAATDREAEGLLDRLLAADPDRPIGQWYKSLLLARRGETDAALARLRHVQALVAADPTAHSVVTELIERLSVPAATGAE